MDRVPDIPLHHREAPSIFPGWNEPGCSCCPWENPFFPQIPEGAYSFGYVNNGMMTMPAMALILVGCVIWVHRAYIYKEEK